MGRCYEPTDMPACFKDKFLVEPQSKFLGMLPLYLMNPPA